LTIKTADNVLRVISAFYVVSLRLRLTRAQLLLRWPHSVAQQVKSWKSVRGSVFGCSSQYVFQYGRKSYITRNWILWV